jgi:hypothetical protein
MSDFQAFSWHFLSISFPSKSADFHCPQDRSLRGVALHMALLLRRAGTLEAIKVLEAPMDVSAFLSLGQELANLTPLHSRNFNEDMTRYGSKLADQFPMVKSLPRIVGFCVSFQGFGPGAPQKSILVILVFSLIPSKQSPSPIIPSSHHPIIDIPHKSPQIPSIKPSSHQAIARCDYASNFAAREQLQYFRALEVSERVQALQRLLLSGAAGRGWWDGEVVGWP